jgi:hypothetical protein
LIDNNTAVRYTGYMRQLSAVATSLYTVQELGYTHLER